MKYFALLAILALPVQAGTHRNLYPYMNLQDAVLDAPIERRYCWLMMGALRCFTW